MNGIRRISTAVLASLAFALCPGAAAAEGSPPSAWTGAGAIDLADGSGDLVMTGRVNPNGSETSCRFEYGPGDPAAEPGPYTGSVPCEAGPGSGTGEVEVRARVAGRDLPTGEASHFRLVAGNAYGTTFGEDRPVATLVCACPGGERPVPGVAVVKARGLLRDGKAELRTECRGENLWCVGDVRLLARIRQPRGEPARQRPLGETSYEVAPSRQETVAIDIPRWARRMLVRAPERIRFVVAGPGLRRHQVHLSLAG